MHPHTTKGVTQRLTAAHQHWSWRGVVIWTRAVNWRGFNSLFPSFLCEQLCSTTKYELTPICCFYLVQPPPPPKKILILTLSSKQTEPAFICLWHIFYAYFQLYLQNHQLMCMLFLYWKLYLHIRLYPFQYCSSSKSVNFTTPGPYWSAQIRSDLVAAHVWLVSAGAPVVAGQAVWEAPELRQNARNVKGHILDRWSCTDLIHAVSLPHIVFFGYYRVGSCAAIVTAWWCSGVCLIKLTASSSMCHFANRSHDLLH